MAPPVRTTAVERGERFSVGDCRFYESKFPEKEDLVMVRVSRVAEMGAYVTLLEYGGLEGMILMSELSKRRIRSIKKIVREGRQEVVLVLRVDREKGYIDLSKKRISPEDVVRCEERFSKGKKVHQIIIHVAQVGLERVSQFVVQKYKVPLEELNKKITWPLHKKYGHALDAFRNPDFSTTIVDSLELDQSIKEALVEVVRLRLAASALRMRARVDVHCYGPEGVDAVREALTKGKEVAAQNDPLIEVKIKLIAPPQYTLITTCTDKPDGEARCTAAIKAIIETIRKYKGGDAVQQSEFVLLGGEEDEHHDKGGDKDADETSSSEDEDEDEEEEDEGMGLVDDHDIPTEETPEENVTK